MSSGFVERYVAAV